MLDEHGAPIEARSSAKAIDVTVGDRVSYYRGDNDFIIQEILPRTNQLQRQNAERIKVFAANVDHLYIVTCAGALFNTSFIDRALISAAEQSIPSTLIVNKIDQEESVSKELEYYQQIGEKVHFTSARTGNGISELRNALISSEMKLVVFCGLSGVGKSSLLNALCPESNRDVGAVSARTGQGKQTTTQSEAFPLYRAEGPPLQIVDLPGFSKFGMVHIGLTDLNRVFPEFTEASSACDFTDCSHREEPNCEVKRRITLGLIERFRYKTYLEIRDEIERARSY